MPAASDARSAGPGGGRPSAAARGIAMALLLSAPVWLGLGVAVWQATARAPGEPNGSAVASRAPDPSGR